MNDPVRTADTVELAKALRREAHREWQRSHPQKVKEYRERYWLKKAEQLLKEREVERT